MEVALRAGIRFTGRRGRSEALEHVMVRRQEAVDAVVRAGGGG